MTIKLNAATGGGSVSLSAPNSTTSNLDVELTLPVDDGTAGQALTTNGSGTLSWASASSDSITEGNTTVECVDTGSDGHITFDTDGTERMRVTNNGYVRFGDGTNYYHTIRGGGGNEALEITANAGQQNASTVSDIKFLNSNSGGAITERLRIASTGAFGLSGENYGTSGQVLTSQGSGSAPQWASPAGGKIVQTKVHTVSGIVSDGVGANSIGSYLMSTTFQLTSSSNSVLIRVVANISTTQDEDMGFVVGVGSPSSPTYIGIGDASASQNRITSGGYTGGSQVNTPTAMCGEFLYSPGNTNNNTYAVYGFNGYHGSATLKLNYSASNDGTNGARTISTMTFFEIAPN